jgi:hypothetical protein
MSGLGIILRHPDKILFRIKCVEEYRGMIELIAEH